MAGIVSYGAYIPYYRLPRGVISKAWGQLQGRADDLLNPGKPLRQIKNPKLGLTHNLGGAPDGCMIFVGIVGLEGA